MKKYVPLIAVIIISFYNTSTFASGASSNQYAVIVDAGSTGSRAHVFLYAKSLPEIPIPVIKDVFSQGSKPGLSSFVNKPSEAGASLKTILDASAKYLQDNGVHLSQVPIKILATAGMRLLTPPQQEAIYADVRHYIKSHYAFSLNDQDVQTISGVMEGVYDWLDVNYLLNNFLHPPDTVGSIDMGGASTQIAFATTDVSMPDNEIAIDINHTHYKVFSQSFLGLGQDQALTAMTAHPSAASCYPSGYSLGSGTEAGTGSRIGHFNFSICSNNYKNIIQNNHVAKNIISTQGQNFIAFSAIYFNYKFFHLLQTPTQSALLAQIDTICYQPWAKLQAEYDGPYLASECANGVYFNDLLYNTYHLQDSQLTVTNQLNGTNIDWTLGALLYGLLR